MQLKYLAPVAALVCAVSAPVQAEDMLSLTKEMLTCMEKMNAQFDTVKDKETATAIAPEIRKLTDQLFDIQARLPKATPPTSAESANEAMEIQKRAQEISEKYQTNVMRMAQGGLMTPELAAAMQPKTQEKAEEAAE